jgi:hypothetical protein
MNGNTEWPGGSARVIGQLAGFLITWIAKGAEAYLDRRKKKQRKKNANQKIGMDGSM